MSHYKIFKDRRQKLFTSLVPNSIAILVGNREVKRSSDVTYPFRQDSDFYYLTGYEEPDAVALFITRDDGGEFILFNQEKNPDLERWVGARIGQKVACDLYLADAAYPINKLEDLIGDFLKNRKTIYLAIGKDAHWEQKILSWVSKLKTQGRAGVYAPKQFINIDSILHEMRLFKDDVEIESMRQAAAISVAAHQKAMQICRPGKKEYELEAELIYEFIRRGSKGPAYSSIVGGGTNACVLHYIENRETLVDGELVLVDAGAEYQNYASDITRTYPVNGQFTSHQAELYELVLATQLAVIDHIRPGVLWNNLQEIAIRMLTEGLIDLGILPKISLEQAIQTKAYQRFYMHNIGHWLGLDVHDVGSYKQNGQWRALEPGMVLTVEPGLYISADKSVPKQWWNMGVRIEDDVLVTEQGCEVLTQDLPKTIAEVENLMRR